MSTEIKTTQPTSEFDLTEQQLQRKARLLALSGDPTRLRILCFLFENTEGCVSDIAGGVNMSIASISHHLQLLRDNGIVQATRMGNKICYNVLESAFINHIREFVCTKDMQYIDL
jgi:DNA-binding transcriptional ArsR family regulator